MRSRIESVAASSFVNEYSGLGVWNPNPNDDTSPPVDHGLGASNPALLQAAKDLGVTYLHGNMSFPSEVPSCFDCGITHPLDANVTVVPDWPTNIWYFSTTPDEETSFYNAPYEEALAYEKKGDKEKALGLLKRLFKLGLASPETQQKARDLQKRLK